MRVGVCNGISPVDISEAVDVDIDGDTLVLGSLTQQYFILIGYKTGYMFLPGTVTAVVGVEMLVAIQVAINYNVTLYYTI